MTIRLSSQQIKAFQKHILDWYAKNKRDLPWRSPSLPPTLKLRRSRKLRRDEGIDPYYILVSEVMSQQTQLSRVVPKYHEWLKAFPTLFDLANASTRDVLFHWSGLGYNRRALYLQKTARELIARGKGKASSVKGKELHASPFTLHPIPWPKTQKELMTLPGIGKYTARALLCFAFGKQVAVVDTNVRKIIMSCLKLENGRWQLVIEHRKQKLEKRVSGFQHQDSNTIFKHLTSSINEKEIEEIAEQLLPKGKAYEWNQALMDYAAIELAPLRPAMAGLRGVKQSRFKDSDRYYRGQIVKISLAQDRILLKDTIKKLKKQIGQERVEKIVADLQKEGLLRERV